MDRDDHIAALRRTGARLADAAEGNLDRPVPSCPGWTITDLVHHLAGFHGFWEGIASGSLADPTAFSPAEPPGAEELVVWFRAGVDALADALAPLAAATERWTWTDDHTAGFIQRRAAQETAVHAWDTVASVGPPEPIDARLAVDGVDEYFDVFVPLKLGHADGRPLSAHLHATDADGEWVVRAGDGRFEVERTHAKGDVAIRATASDLLLLLWGRRSTGDDGFEVFGDPGDVTAFVERTELG